MTWLSACTDQLASPHFASAASRVISGSPGVAIIPVTKLSDKSLPSWRTLAMCFLFLSFTVHFISGQRSKRACRHYFPLFLLFITEERCSQCKAGAAHNKSADSSKWHQLLSDKYKHPRSTQNITVCIGLFGSFVRMILFLWKRLQRCSSFSELWNKTSKRLCKFVLRSVWAHGDKSLWTGTVPGVSQWPVSANTADACQSFTKKKKIYICQSVGAWQKVAKWKTAD